MKLEIECIVLNKMNTNESSSAITTFTTTIIICST